MELLGLIVSMALNGSSLAYVKADIPVDFRSSDQAILRVALVSDLAESTGECVTPHSIAGNTEILIFESRCEGWQGLLAEYDMSWRYVSVEEYCSHLRDDLGRRYPEGYAQGYELPCDPD
ncbi:hypothetical protein [Hyphobacterium sp.]|uniref:hypothetical protein n=1 Tax=Hyphobacterium sp. TaxID=2004662 RepID=UPI003BAD0897